MSKKGKSIFKIVKLIIIIFAVLGLSYYVVIRSGFFNIKQVVVVNNDYLDPRDIIKDTGITGDDNFFLVNLYGPREKLLENPYVKDVEVRRQFPDKVEITVYEREEFSSIFIAGTYVIIDEQGRVLRSVDKEVDIMTIKGYNIESYRIGEIMTSDDAYEFQRALDLVDLCNQVEALEADEISYEKGSIFLKLLNGLSVDFGNGKDIEEKFSKFYAIYEDLVSKGIKKGIINVSNNGLPTYRPF